MSADASPAAPAAPATETAAPAMPAPAVPAPAEPAGRPAGLADDVRVLLRSRVFWAGLATKAAFSVLFGSHFATRWFSPFVYQFVHSHFEDPWAAFLAAGEPLAFPYGPGMLATFSVPFAPAWLFSFDPAGHLGLALLRVPVLLADVGICLMLLGWRREHAREVLLLWWLNPIVLYASYVHGQLDLVPGALLCLALSLVFARRLALGAVVLGAAVGFKLHLLVALPFLWAYVLRLRQPPARRLAFGLLAAGTAAALYLPAAGSPAFRRMVFGTPFAQTVWELSAGWGAGGPLLYLCPAALAVVLLRFLAWRRLNRDLTLMFLGLAYAVLVATVPPMPGWFLWSAPFVVYHAARHSRTGRPAQLGLSLAYLTYFVLSSPATTLEVLDPTLGAGTGAAAAAALQAALPAAFSPRGVNLAWTLLFTATMAVAADIYLSGVRASPLYRFRSDAFLLGIGGDSGTGKHTLAEDLLLVLGPRQLRVVLGDDDHRWERDDEAWRSYTHLDPRGNRLGLQAEHLQALRRGERIVRRSYDHATGRFGAAQRVEPADFVAIVGLHPFYLASQREALQLRIFLDPDEALRRRWKAERDVARRGHAPEQVGAETVRRLADGDRYVRPQMRYADLVLRCGPFDREHPPAVDLSVELASALQPLELADRLGRLGTLTAQWTPDETLQRDKLTLAGTATAAQIGALARELESPLDDVLAGDAGRWHDGTRGLAQLIVFYSILRRMSA